MKIGPLIQPPPLVPFMTGFGGALQAAGMMEGSKLLLPSGISSAGVIEYDAQETSIYAEILEDRPPFDTYRGLVEGREQTSAFISQCEKVDRLTDMKTFEVSSALRRMRDFGMKLPDSLPDMLSRLDSQGEHSIGEIANLVHSNDSSKIPASMRGELMERVADDVEFAASVSYEFEGAYYNEEAAGFYYVAGTFHAMSGAEGSIECAVGALLQSARIYSEIEMDIAAALVAEAAVYFSALGAGKGDPKSETLRKAAGYWLRVAEASASSDEAAALIAIQRGMLSAMIHEGESLGSVRRRFNSLAAMMNERFGMHTRSGQDYLRMSSVDLMNFEGGVRCWERIADSIYKAIGAYERAGDESMQRRLRPLEAMARRQSKELAAELAEVEPGLANDPDDPVLRQEMAFVRMGHGDLIGALDDLQSADEASPGNAWILSDIALALHHIAHYLMFLGDLDRAQSGMAKADEYMEAAQKIATASDVEIPILYARAGALLFTLGRHEAAIERLTMAHALDQGDEEIYDYLRVVRLNAPNVLYPLH